MNLPINKQTIYGEDNRRDLYLVNDAVIQRNASCVAAIVNVLPSEDVISLANGDLWINNSKGILEGDPQFEISSAIRYDLDNDVTAVLRPWNQARKLAESEPFYHQFVFTLGSSTGFLVAPDVIATAAHCLYDAAKDTREENFTHKRVIFGFQMRNDDPTSALQNWQVYRIRRVFARKFYDEFGTDWAIAQLDRPVSRQWVAPIRHQGKVSDYQPIHVIGHPSGLPLKYADGASVQQNTNPLFFFANTDTYQGNSGSPIFNSHTHVVEGILSVGDTDFDEESGQSNRNPDWYGKEVATRAIALAPALMKNSWSGFKPIPGLMGSENSDGDVAVVHLTPDGRPALIVAFIQKSAGQNRIYYQVGYGLDEQGNSQRWSEFLSIPGRFSASLQGLGIAVADLNRNGRPDLVVFYIVKNAKGNQGYYRIGRDLDAAGNVTGGWTRPQAMPGRLGVSTQGAGIAIADLSGKGQFDLISFYVDAPQGENRGFYRVGRNLNPDGIALAGWSEAVRVPGWFGEKTQGAGVAVTQMPGNSRPDLIIFHIDNPRGANGNRAYYRIGRTLDAAGNVTDGWSEVRQLPGEWGFENQGGGITVAHLGRHLGERSHPHPHLITFNIFNPPGGNYGRYRVGWLLP